MKLFNLATILLFCSLCIGANADTDTKAGSRADRQALYDYLLAKTLEREAFSALKNQKLGLDFAADMAAMREEFLAADTELKLFYALRRMSNLRRDSHLSVKEVKGGLDDGHDKYDKPLSLPLKFYFEPGDHVASEPRIFVRDLGKKQLDNNPGGNQVQLGDYLLSINGVAVKDYLQQLKPYYRSSTELGFLGRLMPSFHRQAQNLPPGFFPSTVQLTFFNPQQKKQYTVAVDYLDEDDIKWQQPEKYRYAGFKRVLDTDSFDFYVHQSKKVVLFDWYGFRRDLVSAMDEVIDYAKQHNLLSYDVIWDGTTSRGGGRGAYAIQRLVGKPFKTTFGNVKISDIMPAFMRKKLQQFKQKQLSDGVSETVGSGDLWQAQWWINDVKPAIKAGQAYSNNVPFKLAHAPKWSDGIIYPHEDHFTGNMVCILGPKGGSHLDQFAAIVKDNKLCHIIGMPAGGYSNTWEWTETLKMPTTGQPLVSYMWNIGHTIRPNGQVLEGNPARVDEFIPPRAASYNTYRWDLVQRAMQILVEGDKPE